MTDWLGTILWILTGTILLIVLRIYRSVTVDQISTSNPETPTTIYKILQSLIGIVAVSSAILSHPYPKMCGGRQPTSLLFVLLSGGFGSLSKSKTYQNSIKVKQLL